MEEELLKNTEKKKEKKKNNNRRPVIIESFVLIFICVATFAGYLALCRKYDQRFPPMPRYNIAYLGVDYLDINMDADPDRGSPAATVDAKVTITLKAWNRNPHPMINKGTLLTLFYDDHHLGSAFLPGYYHDKKQQLLNSTEICAQSVRIPLESGSRLLEARKNKEQIPLRLMIAVESKTEEPAQEWLWPKIMTTACDLQVGLVHKGHFSSSCQRRY